MTIDKEHISHSDNKALRAMANPIRLQILSMMTGQSCSASQVSADLGLRHGSASYHLRQLRDAGLVEIDEVVKVNGGREKRYKSVLLGNPDSPHNLQSSGDIRMIVETIAAELRRKSQFSSPGVSAAIDGEFWVPPSVWREVRDSVRDASRRLHKAALPTNTTSAVHCSLSALLFEMTDDSSRNG